MESLTLFQMMDAKLAYASQRQGILALNIANADTPGYQSFDLKPLDFKSILRDVNSDRPRSGLSQTSATHITAKGLGSGDGDIDGMSAYEVAPAGNAVDIEEQMLKAAKNNSEATFVTNLYAKQLSLLRLAAGVNGR